MFFDCVRTGYNHQKDNWLDLMTKTLFSICLALYVANTAQLVDMFLTIISVDPNAKRIKHCQEIELTASWATQ